MSNNPFRTKTFSFLSAHQHSSAVYVQNLSSNKACVRSAKKEHAGGNFLRLAHAAERNGRVYPLADLRVLQGGSSHICCYPTRRNAVYIDAITHQFGGEPFDHA